MVVVLDGRADQLITGRRATTETRFSGLLSELARTMLTDAPIQAILDKVAASTVVVLPVTGAGVTLIAPGVAPRRMAASDDAAMHVEQLQTTLHQGPSLMAYELGRAVSVPDLAFDDRFPEFREAAGEAGLRSVFSFPLRHGSSRLGALDVYRDKPGSLRPYEMVTAQALADVAAAYLVNAHEREQIQAVADHHRMSALHDALTGLPNRVQFQQRLEHAAQRASRSHSTAAVLYADLDRFKQVNDQHGHAVGDELLVAVAERLLALLRPGDTLARLSGDEFVFLCENIAAERDSQNLAARIRGAFARPFPLTAGLMTVTASVGVAYAGPGEAIGMDLVGRADRAMYRAKRANGSSGPGAVVDLEAARAVREHASVAPDLPAAMVNGELGLTYQPIVAASSGALCGVASLLRWQHPRLGVIAASTALGIAEQSGHAPALGTWGLDRSCRDWLAWSSASTTALPYVSVDVSVEQLMGIGFCEAVAAVLQRTGMPPAALMLEVPEAPLLGDPQRALSVLADLSSLGVRLALDDFGTGQSALASLRDLPFDTVKIGASLVAGLDVREGGTALVAALIDLGHALGLNVVAEGVETERQRRALVRLGGDQAQGPLLAPPLEAARLLTWICADRDPAAHLVRQKADQSSRSTSSS